MYHKLNHTGCFCINFFRAYHVIHAFCEQNKPLKWSLNYICGNEYFKYVIDCKVYMKLSVRAREKNFFKAKKFWTPFFYLSIVWKGQCQCRSAIGWVQNRLEGWDIWPFTIFTRYILNQWKMLCYRKSKRLIDICTGTFSFISLNIKLKIVFSGTCKIIMIRSEWIHRKISFAEKKFD